MVLCFVLCHKSELPAFLVLSRNVANRRNDSESDEAKHLVIGGIHVGGDQHVPCDVFEFGHLKLGARLWRNGVFRFNQVVVAINVFGDDVPAFEVKDVSHLALAGTNLCTLPNRHVRSLVIRFLNFGTGKLAVRHPLPIRTFDVKPSMVAGFRVKPCGAVRVYLQQCQPIWQYVARVEFVIHFFTFPHVNQIYGYTTS